MDVVIFMSVLNFGKKYTKILASIDESLYVVCILIPNYTFVTKNNKNVTRKRHLLSKYKVFFEFALFYFIFSGS